MVGNSFAKEGAFEYNPKWEQLIKREHELYKRQNDIRSEFVRDYNRILHSRSYRRLKHKTQVFFATKNDHICTRIEHVNHVASVSYTIARFLGLNTELTTAIANGHDIGHAPFGHTGEEHLREIAIREIDGTFWHERNSLRFVDRCETITDDRGKEKNLNLTYAVRDGIICHCGEVDETALYPRDNVIDLYKIERASEFSPYTWEGCIVKIADKISYLGRDIEDALTLGFLSKSQLLKLARISKETIGVDLRHLTNTLLIHEFIIDLCKSSSPEKGLRLSRKYYDLMVRIREFSAEYIYQHPRIMIYKDYSKLILSSIFEVAKNMYNSEETLENIARHESSYPSLVKTLKEWIFRLFDIKDLGKLEDCSGCIEKYENKKIYSLAIKEDYIKAVIDYISGMTDSFAIKVFDELTSF